MPIQIRCPNPSCGKTGRVSEESGGRGVRCRHCGHAFVIPSGETVSPVSRASCKQSAPATEGSISPSLAPEPSVQAARPAGVLVPAQIGRFVIRERLGSGAFSDVYRAADPQLQREVALKVPRPEVLQHPEVIERFLREGKAAAGLNHPHIVPVYDAGQDGGHYYLAAAYIAGQTLERAAEAKKLDLRRSAEVVRDLAEALAYAHGQGIIHRDVKPANVLLDEQGVPYLTDFGLAHRREVGEQLTHDGAIMGTPAYMAPEQARGQKGKPLPADDQYSLGVVLYELLTGKTPFNGPAPLILYNVVHTEPPLLHTRNPEVPCDLETICLKAMAKEPEQRYAGCQELADDLRRWLDGEPIHARRLRLGERLWRWGKREPRLAALAAVMVVCLVFASVLGMVKAAALAEAEEETSRLLAEAEEQAALARERATVTREKTTEADRDATRARQAEESAKKDREAAREASERQEKEQQAAVAARQEAEKQEKENKQLLYQSHVELVHLALDQRDTARARALLSRHVPGPDQEDFRKQDWHALWGRLQGQELLALELKGHTSAVRSVAFSADGKRIASGSEDKTGKVWDAHTGQEQLTLKGHTSPVNSVAFSADGRRIVSGNDDRTVKVWDAHTGQEIRTLKGHTSPVNSVAFSADGKRIASGGSDQTVKVWDAHSGQEERTLKGHTDSVRGVCFSPEGKYVASASDDKTVKVWDAQTGKEQLTLKRHSGWVWSVAFSADGKRIVSGSYDKTVRVWDAHTGQEQLTLKGHTGYVWSVAFSADSKRIVSGSYDQTVKVWDAHTGQQQLTLQGHTSWVWSVAFSADGKRLVSGSDDGAVKVFWRLPMSEDKPPIQSGAP